jgi:hypothetical protein
MKIQPTMDNKLFAAYYSDSLTTSSSHAKYDTKNNYTSAAGLRCTGSLDYPAAKAINALSPVVSGGNHKHRRHHSHHSSFDIIANKLFTRELVSSNRVHNSRARSFSDDGVVSRFDENLRSSLLVGKIDRLKLEGTDNHNSSSARIAPTVTTTTCESKVRFATITIQEYPIEPGVNPGGTKGCPLTIGWDPLSTKHVDLDVFENARSENRRDLSQLKLVSAHREKILLGMGYTMRSIQAGTKAANLTRRSRFGTISRLHTSSSQEMLEGFRSNVHNFVTLGNKKRREQKFLAPYATATATTSTTTTTTTTEA